MWNQLILPLLCLFTLSGCTATARLYPVQGPLSTQTPVPVYVAKLTASSFYSGAFSAVLNEGETFRGRWDTVRRPNSPKTPATVTDPPTGSMAADWDTVYGPGFYVAHVLGARLYGRSVVTGDRGTTLTMEIYKPDIQTENASTGLIKGVARDSKDNLYKVAF
jgi:hypothetical protein